MINYLSEHIILPLSDRLTGYKIRSALNFLNKSQYWDKEQIHAFRNKQLRLLVKHAYDNVPYYTDLFNKYKLLPEHIQTADDLQKLPITTKAELKMNRDKLLAKNVSKNELIYMSSSGSTGEPFQFYTTKSADSYLKAAAIRSWYWMGYCLGDSYVKVSMNARQSLLKRIQDKANNSLYLSSTQLKEEVFSEFNKQIKAFDPEFIRCYPAPLYFLSQQIQKTDGHYSGKKLKAINTTGSTLNDNVRKQIETVFGVKIFDSYSCEGGTIFAQCPQHSNYHPAEEYAISEFLEDSFTHSNSERSLRHITTDLFNMATPFIRYDTEDYLVLGDQDKCVCGRSFINIKKILGRDSDILVTPSGKYLIVENFVAYFEWIKEVEQIQIVQEEIDHIIIKMVVNLSFNNDIKLKLQNYWNDYIGSDVKVELQIVNEILLTPTGKRRTLIRNPKIKLNN